MTLFAPTIEAFFTERLMTQREASPRTIASYRDGLRLLLGFAHRHTGKTPSTLAVDDIDADLVSAFLDHLERDRRNTARTRNTRLAAIHSLFRYAAFQHPEHAQSIQRVLAIPAKRHDRAEVDYLEPEEVDALLTAVDQDSWLGRRDHTVLVLMVQTGLRVSELCRLACGDVQTGTGAHVRCTGKGRKTKATPLTAETVTVVNAWTRERAGAPEEPLFPTTRGGFLSVDAVQWLLAKHSAVAARSCPSLATKKVSPHVLRHTCAMNLLHAGVDTALIALWLGHESTQTTQIYVHADMKLKERALARTAPTGAKPGRYRPPDPLLAFLEGL